MLPFVDSSEFFRQGEETTRSERPVSTDVDVASSALEDREQRRQRFTRWVGATVAGLSFGTLLALALPARVDAPEPLLLIPALSSIATSIPTVIATPRIAPPVASSAEKSSEKRSKTRRPAPARTPAAVVRPSRARPNTVVVAPQRSPLDRPPPTARFAD